MWFGGNKKAGIYRIISTIFFTLPPYFILLVAVAGTVNEKITKICTCSKFRYLYTVSQENQFN